MNVYVLMYTERYDDTWAIEVYESATDALRVCNQLNECIDQAKTPGTGYSVQECRFFKAEPPTPVASA